MKFTGPIISVHTYQTVFLVSQHENSRLSKCPRLRIYIFTCAHNILDLKGKFSLALKDKLKDSSGFQKFIAFK